MSRIRTIKPEFWRHEELSALPEATHMLAAALLNYADDEGYFNANPSLVRAECSPLREPSVSVQDSLTSLQKIGFVDIGRGADGKRYGRVAKFADHQRVNRPTPSKIKAVGVVWEASPTPPPQLTEGSSPERKGKEGKGSGSSEPNGSGAVAPAKVSVPAGDPKTEAFKIGKAVLGKNYGGLVTKLQERFSGDWLAVIDILKQAETKADPTDWIGGVLRGTEKGRTPDHVLFPEEIYRGLS